MKNIPAKFAEFTSTFISFVTKYRITLFIVFTSFVLAIMFIDISSMSDANPTDQQVTDSEKSVKVIVFKEQSVKVINSLKANNIEIDTLFDPSRYDPFNN